MIDKNSEVLKAVGHLLLSNHPYSLDLQLWYSQVLRLFQTERKPPSMNRKQSQESGSFLLPSIGSHPLQCWTLLKQTLYGASRTSPTVPQEETFSKAYKSFLPLLLPSDKLSTFYNRILPYSINFKLSTLNFVFTVALFRIDIFASYNWPNRLE